MQLPRARTLLPPSAVAVVVVAVLVAASTLAIALSLRHNGYSSWANHFLGWLNLAAADDSWMPMRVALDYLATAADPAQLYSHIFFESGIKFQYAPSSLLALASLDAAFGHPLSVSELGLINAALVTVNIGVVGVLGMILARQHGWGPRIGLPLAMLGCVIAVCFYPLLKAYTLGQLQVWINVLFALACLAWAMGFRAAAGILIGLIVLLKPQFALFGVWALWRRQTSFLLGFSATLGLGLAASILTFGWDVHLAYLDVLRSLARTGEAFHANQSFNGVLNRLFETADSLEWTKKRFPSYHPAVHYGTLAFSAVLLALCFWSLRQQARRQPARTRAPASLAELQAAALAFTLASPIAWEHHYGILPAAYLVAFTVCLQRHSDPGRIARWLALAVSYVLMAFSVPAWSELWPGSPWNLAQSHHFIGALLLLWLLLALIHRQTQTSTPRRAPHPGGLPAATDSASLFRSL